MYHILYRNLCDVYLFWRDAMLSARISSHNFSENIYKTDHPARQEIIMRKLDDILGDISASIADNEFPDPKLYGDYGPMDTVQVFKKMALNSTRALIGHALLRPRDNVLDLGCGIGRVALPLTRYLDSDGSYQGLDIVERGIDWCNQNISPRYENFTFERLDIYNKMYNPKGKLGASTFKLPFPDESLDLVFAFSLFSHLVPDDLNNYLREVNRILKPQGRLFATFYVLSDLSLRSMKSGTSARQFAQVDKIYWTDNQNLHEGAVAYPEDYLFDAFEKAGYSRMPIITYGQWCGRKHFVTGQDSILCWK